MEEHRRSKRKPLSNCTNTLHHNNNQPSKTLIKPPKFPPILLKNNNKKKKNRNPNLSSNQIGLLVSGTSPTFDLSTGSNNSPISEGTAVGQKSIDSATQTQRQDEQTTKDKGKSVESTPIVQLSSDTAPQAMQISSSAASDDGAPFSCSPPAENHELDEQRRKDKGKMVVETPIIEITTPLTSHTLQTSSSASAASGNHHLPGPSAVDSHKQDAQADKGTGKGSPEISNLEAFGPSTPPAVITSSAASGNRYLPGPSAVDCHIQDAQANKGIKNVGQEMPNIEASGPVTPHPVFTSSSAASDGQEKTSLIVYNQRRTPQRKKFGAGSISLPFSCPPSKKARKKGAKLDDKSSDSRVRSYTDPLPLHKKKRARNKKDDCVHAMPLDEVTKLKAYFADIDAFELPEEVASESDYE
ncbi:hypothetical protein vseg_006698 [Gypsophila vaccaria]